MDYYKGKKYNVNYDYYINECNKIIEPIEFVSKNKEYKQELMF